MNFDRLIKYVLIGLAVLMVLGAAALAVSLFSGCTVRSIPEPPSRMPATPIDERRKSPPGSKLAAEKPQAKPSTTGDKP